jgi:glycosyltransferase involved in cell wall biosynthesis
MTSTPALATPKVSVIIPCYNTAHLIATCLDSVFAQTYKDFEATVVNDGSPDTPELEKVLAPYRDRIVYIKQENKRAAGARNNAIRQARGEFVAFLDSDDSWLPNHLALQMQIIADDPSLDLVYANGALVGAPVRYRDFMAKCPSNGKATFEALILERCQVPISTVVARKRTLMEAGLFDEKLPRCDDYDMWVRAAFVGARIAYRRSVQAQLSVGRPGCLSASRSKMAEAYWNILEKIQRDLPLNDYQSKLVRRRAAEIRALYLLEEGKYQLSKGQFEKARQLLAQANAYAHSFKCTLAVAGLGIAPHTTGTLISLWSRIRNGSLA